jgi:uncharacterized protein
MREDPAMFSIQRLMGEKGNFLELLEASAEQACQSAACLRKFLSKPPQERLEALEGAADHLMNDLLREVYSGRIDPVSVIALRDLHELLEKSIDRCRDAGNAVFRAVLKSS